MRCYARGVAGVLIISPDWTSRALLRAQLLEDGCPVYACQSVRDAAAVLESGEFQAGLIFADFSSGARTDEVDDLAEIARLRSVPVWAMAPHGAESEPWTSHDGFERVLFRPMGVGELTEQIEQRLKHPQRGSST